MKTTTTAPTLEQLEAIRLFAAANGRYWKAVLREIWMNGRYDTVELSGADPALLQQLRNNQGPSWLVRFSLKRGK